jgi:periplasmic divalent cation tolerance protein
MKEARRLAGLLLSKKVAACIQLIPGLESHYRWKEKKEAAKEVLLIIKTRAPLYKKVEALILKHHPYEVPEIICLPITKGNLAYLKWIDGETSPR